MVDQNYIFPLALKSNDICQGTLRCEHRGGGGVHRCVQVRTKRGTCLYWTYMPVPQPPGYLILCVFLTKIHKIVLSKQKVYCTTAVIMETTYISYVSTLGIIIIYYYYYLLEYYWYQAGRRENSPQYPPQHSLKAKLKYIISILVKYI